MRPKEISISQVRLGDLNLSKENQVLNGTPMKKIKKEIQSKIDELSDVEKLLVVDYILADLDKPDPEIDKAWAKEALRRQKAMRSGKMKVFLYDEVMKKYLK
jgi:putative addiction module component